MASKPAGTQPQRLIVPLLPAPRSQVLVCADCRSLDHSALHECRANVHRSHRRVIRVATLGAARASTGELSLATVADWFGRYRLEQFGAVVLHVIEGFGDRVDLESGGRRHQALDG